MAYFCISPAGGEKIANLDLPKCDLQGGNRLERAKFCFFRAAGAPILGFFDYFSDFFKFDSGGGAFDPPLPDSRF